MTHLEPLLNAGRLYLHREAKEDSDFVGELTDFSVMSKGHDDCLDAVAGAVSGLGIDTIGLYNLPPNVALLHLGVALAQNPDSDIELSIAHRCNASVRIAFN